jgi:hypothetical protein
VFYHDVKYIKQVSYRLDLFKVKKDTGSSFSAQCRCPICGDSQKSERKARGGFYTISGKVNYKCFNCGASQSTSKFLEWFDFNVYQEYRLEVFGKSSNETPQFVKVQKPSEPEYEPLTILSDLVKIKDLSNDAPAKKYLIDRDIPKYAHNILYYAPKFYEWTLGHTDKFKGMPNDHPRIVIPWFDENNNLFAYQARAINKHPTKYYSIVLNKKPPRVYGLDRVNWDNPIHVVEGPVDSLFLRNGVAVGTSALYNFQTEKQECIYIPDNENRNTEILKIYDKLIKMNKTIVIPPNAWEYKDINEAVSAGEDIDKMIKENTYHGLRARLRFSEWCKRDI